MPNLTIGRWLADRANAAELTEFVADRLLEMCSIDTTAVADLSGLSRREKDCYDLIEQSIRASWENSTFTEHPFAPEIRSHPSYTFPYYAYTHNAYTERYNLICHLTVDAGHSTAPALAINAHIDTVAPFFRPHRRGNVIFGRGACDDKGACITLVAAMRLLREACDHFGTVPSRDILLMFVTDEETGGNGSLSVALDQNLKRSYDAVIVLECCDGHIHPANRGAVWYRLEIPSGIPHAEDLALRTLENLEEEGRAIRAESDHPLFPDRPVQTNHGILGPYGEFPSRICGYVEMEVVTAVAPDELQGPLQKGLSRYTAAYGDKTAEVDSQTGRPKVPRHFELDSVPVSVPVPTSLPVSATPPQDATHAGEAVYRLKVWGSSAHMGAILENDNALTKLAYLVAALRAECPDLRIRLPKETAAPETRKAPSPLVMEGGQGFLPTHGIAEIKERLSGAAAVAYETFPHRVEGLSPRMTFDKLHNDAYDGDADGRLFRSCRAAGEIAGLSVNEPVRGWNVSCDARLFAHAHPGMEVITLGPGKLTHAHSDNEQVDIKEIGRHAAALALLLLSPAE